MPIFPPLRTPNPNLFISDGVAHNTGSSTMVSTQVEARAIYIPAKIIEYCTPPIILPLFTSFSIVGRVSLLEVGDVFVGGIRTFNWGISNPENLEAESISITSSSAGLLDSNLTNDGTEDVDTGLDIAHPSLFTEVWTISANDINSDPFSTSISISWRWQLYYGYSEATSLTGTDILNLQNDLLSFNRNGTYTIGSVGFKYVAWPTVFGEANSIKDPIGFDIALSGVEIVSVTNDFGVTEDYYVYRTLYRQNGDVTMVVT